MPEIGVYHHEKSDRFFGQTFTINSGWVTEPILKHYPAGSTIKYKSDLDVYCATVVQLTVLEDEDDTNPSSSSEDDQSSQRKLKQAIIKKPRVVKNVTRPKKKKICKPLNILSNSRPTVRVDIATAVNSDSRTDRSPFKFPIPMQEAVSEKMTRFSLNNTIETGCQTDNWKEVETRVNFEILTESLIERLDKHSADLSKKMEVRFQELQRCVLRASMTSSQMIQRETHPPSSSITEQALSEVPFDDQPTCSKYAPSINYNVNCKQTGRDMSVIDPTFDLNIREFDENDMCDSPSENINLSRPFLSFTPIIRVAVAPPLPHAVNQSGPYRQNVTFSSIVVDHHHRG